MCGNRGRCNCGLRQIYLGIVDKNKPSFMAVDGLHNANYRNGIVSWK